MGWRALLARVIFVFLSAMMSFALPSPSRATWVNSAASQFQVGGKLGEIVPTLVSTAPGIANSPALVDPTCGSQGGTSLALVPGSKLAGVNPVLYPVVLVVSCLDNGGSATTRSRLNFINPSPFSTIVNGTNVNVAAGTVVKQLSTTIGGVTAAPSNGWAHLVHRPDMGDLLGCGADGTLYRIDYSQTGTATTLSTPVLGSCGGLAWDAEQDTIYQGVLVAGKPIGSVARFKEGAVSPDASFTTSLSCEANGLAISGGVLLMSCAGLVNNTLVIQRIDKKTGANLGLYSSISLPVPGSTVSGFLGLTSLGNADPGLGDLACDPVTFQKDAAGRDLYRDAVWSRRGVNGNGVAAVEFPPFTCGLPSNSVVGSFSPLAAGLSSPGPNGPGQFPLAACFDIGGIVRDSDGDGLPDCWETNSGGSKGPGGIDFDGDGTTDLTLCAQVNIDGGKTTTLTPECADPNHKDLFVEVGWMANHQPDPQALSQQQSVLTVGVQSVREAFGAAPVGNPVGGNGINIHIQVDKQPVTFLNFTGTTMTSHVTNVALTPCTGPASQATSPADAADYDAIKATNFGRFDTAKPPLSANAVNAMRLAFRYVLFAHNLVGNPSGGSNSSGCAEVGGDDAVVALGSFSLNWIGHPGGTTDDQAGTFMHEFGHLLGFQHGGEDAVNNKPNYRSVMNYTRQFSGSPIVGRRLDYSRSEVDLTEGALFECSGIGSDPSLGPIPNPGNPAVNYFAADQIAFGPGALSVVTPWPLLTGPIKGEPCTVPLSPPAPPSPAPINWNRATISGNVYQATATSGDINGDGSLTTLLGSNDWANVLYRFSAAIAFAGGRSETPFTPGSTSEMTKGDQTTFFLLSDSDLNLVGDGQDCGTAVAGTTTMPVAAGATTVAIGGDPKMLGFAFSSGTGFLGSGSTLDAFTYTGTNGSGFTGVSGVDNAWPSGTIVLAPKLCPAHQIGINPDDGSAINASSTHRIDIKPSAPFPKQLFLGNEANVTIAIFSEPLGVGVVDGLPINWNASTEIKVDAVSLQQHPLTFTVESVKEAVKTNSNGSGTCSVSDVADPFTGAKDGVKDLKCQFPTSGLPLGTHIGVVTGFFFDPLTKQFTAFTARQDITIMP